MITVITKNYPKPPVCEQEILRYAGCKSPDNETLNLLKTCLNEAEDVLKYKVCFCVLPLKISDDLCELSGLRILSANLSKNLSGCNKSLLFGATLGVGIDRLISKYGKISPAKALMMQAIGTERIEALCDTFCGEYCKENDVGLTPRYSPGYGDLSLEVQRKIFDILSCSKNIGLSLNDSLLMSPSKSVTAFAGIGKSNEKTINKCTLCENAECIYRSKT